LVGFLRRRPLGADPRAPRLNPSGIRTAAPTCRLFARRTFRVGGDQPMGLGGIVEEPRILAARGELPFGFAQPLGVELALQTGVGGWPSDRARRRAMTLLPADPASGQCAAREHLLALLGPVHGRRMVAEEVRVAAVELLHVVVQVEDENGVCSA